MLVSEIKTESNAKKNPDFIKLATLLKNILDFALNEGLGNHTSIGLLIEGASCKLYRLHMPFSKLYCMTEILSFNLPENVEDIFLNEKMEKLLVSILQCRKLIELAITSLHTMSSSPVSSEATTTVDSYFSPPKHCFYFK